MGKIEWSTAEAPLKDRLAIGKLIDRIETKFVQFVEAPLKAKWGLDGGAPESGSPEEKK